MKISGEENLTQNSLTYSGRFFESIWWYILLINVLKVVKPEDVEKLKQRMLDPMFDMFLLRGPVNPTDAVNGYSRHEWCLAINLSSQNAFVRVLLSLEQLFKSGFADRGQINEGRQETMLIEITGLEEWVSMSDKELMLTGWLYGELLAQIETEVVSFV